MPIQLSDFRLGWHTYLLLCQDRSYYCGISSDLRQRLHDHSSGKGSSYTKGKRPLALVWFEWQPTRQAAARREKEIKGWGREKKQRLAAGGVWVSLVRKRADSG